MAHTTKTFLSEKKRGFLILSKVRMSSSDPYQQRYFWETPDLSLLKGYLDREIVKNFREDWRTAKKGKAPELKIKNEPGRNAH